MAKIPSDKHGSWKKYLFSIFPGLALCIVLGVFARWIDKNIIPDEFFVINYVLIAIVLGLVVKNVFKIPNFFNEGIDFSTKICLFTGVVLLGARLNLIEIFSIGANAIIMVAISITLCITLCGFLAKKIGANERWGHLVGAGIGVCGVSAVIALAPAIKAKEREILTAIGAALLTDVIVLLILPPVAHSLGWSDMLVGFIAGVVPSNTAQCIAIGHAYSDAAGTIATIVKSSRNALLPVVILVMTFIYTRRGLPVGEKVRLGLLWSKFPKFIVGLILAATASTVGLIPVKAISMSNNLSTWFFVVCFVGIGAGIDLKELGRQDLSVISFGFVMTFILWIYAYLYSTIILVF